MGITNEAWRRWLLTASVTPGVAGFVLLATCPLVVTGPGPVGGAGPIPVEHHVVQSDRQAMYFEYVVEGDRWIWSHSLRIVHGLADGHCQVCHDLCGRSGLRQSPSAPSTVMIWPVT